MEMEGVFGHAFELGEADLGEAPEAFDAVDVHRAVGKLVVSMIDAQVAVAEIDQAVVAAPAIGVDDGRDIDAAPDNALQRGSGAVRHDLGVDLSGALEDAEHDGLAVGAPATLAADVAGTEPALIDLDDTEQRTLRFAGRHDALPQATIQPVHGIAVQPTELGGLQGRRISCKAAHKGSDLAFRNVRTPGVAVLHCPAWHFGPSSEPQLGKTLTKKS